MFDNNLNNYNVHNNFWSKVKNFRDNNHFLLTRFVKQNKIKIIKVVVNLKTIEKLSSILKFSRNRKTYHKGPFK